MKVVMTAIAVIGMLAISPEVKADSDEAWAAFGGFLGGIIVGSAIDSPHHVVRYDTYVSTRGHSHHRGNEYTRVKTWVDGYWEKIPKRCGGYKKVWHPGYYEYSLVKARHSRGRSHAHGKYGRSSRRYACR